MLMFVVPVTHLEAVIGTHNVMAAPVCCKAITASTDGLKTANKTIYETLWPTG